MRAEDMLWEFLPSGLKGVFEIKKVSRDSTSYHVWLDEVREKSGEDRFNHSIVGKGYTDYCTIQDHMMRGVPMYLHLRKCKWLDKDSGSIFTYDIDYDSENGTRLTNELVSFLKGEG